MTKTLTLQAYDWAMFGGKIFGLLISALLGLLYVKQDSLLYMPNPPGFPKTPDDNPPGWTSPDEWTTQGRRARGRSDPERIPFEDKILLTSDGASIHTWLLLQPNAHEVPTLLYFHGNAGNMGFRLKNAALMYAFSGINVLMMDYRGYGKSTGTPTEKGLNIDAEAVMDYAFNHPRLKGSPLVAFGRSLGGAVSFSLAHKHPDRIKAIVVENTFLSIAAMVDRLMPYVSRLKSLILRINWDSDVKIKDLKQPILFISGENDELVPTFHMRRLVELAQNSVYKELFSVPGGTHNDTWEKAFDYYERLRLFFTRALGTPALKNAGASSSVGGSGATRSAYGVAVDDSGNVELPTMRTNFQVK